MQLEFLYLTLRSQLGVQYVYLGHAYSIDSYTILLRFKKNTGRAKLFHARQCHSRHNKFLTDCTSMSVSQMVDNRLVTSYQTIELNLCDYANNTHSLQEMKDNT